MRISDDVLNLKDTLMMDKNYFNANPELGFLEYKTSNYISKRLSELGFEVRENIAQTGVMGLIRGDANKPCIMFRADMDAILTDPDDPNSIKHACGHDAHMAILLGLANLLTQKKNSIKGTVKLVFQPGEEGLGGAASMIDQGVLEHPTVDKAFALHVWSEVEEGKIGICGGPVMASGDEFLIEILGKAGHAALPEKSIDAIFIASQVVVALQSIVSRNVSPIETVVVSICSISGGCNFNTICEKVTIKGTCRTYDNEVRRFVSERIKHIAVSIARSFGGDAVVEYIFKHPPVINSQEEAIQITKLSEQIVGSENVIKSYRTMCTEDFSHFQQKIPGTLTFIGCQSDKYYPQHNPNFYVNEKAMLIGLELFCSIAKKYLI
ncbi:MAG: hypothetical protein APF81_21905 [Desulfosporosinus sp. BRH_c37]|nr:MAG: hypothetical protein APF81_21905 [Desulfosporosinus sp. BRH_c37]